MLAGREVKNGISGDVAVCQTSISPRTRRYTTKEQLEFNDFVVILRVLGGSRSGCRAKVHHTGYAGRSERAEGQLVDPLSAPLQERAKSRAAMAVTALLFGTQFGKRLVDLWEIEEWIVSETVLASR